MRYRQLSEKRDLLGQVFTPPALAARLIEVLGGRGGRWLELGVGGGRLMQACFAAANPDVFVGIEVDPTLSRLHPTSSRRLMQHADVLNPVRLEAALAHQRFDCSIGNPPFGEAKLPPGAQLRLDALCPGLAPAPWARLDLYFVLESLTRLKRPGAAAFIVGSPLIDGAALAPFRKLLVDQASEIQCLELPSNTFHGAEVRSYLLMVRFVAKRGACRVRIGRLDGDEFDRVADMTITPAQAMSRMDLSFYEFADLHRALMANGAPTLRDIGGGVVRGSRSKNQFEAMGVPCFHTTDFPDAPEIAFRGPCDSGYQLAEPGHILVPRVGTRCLDRQVMVSKGRRPYTEAVYRVSVPVRYQTRVFDWMRSSEGIAWRIKAANGACAKHLTVTTLMDMPIPR